MTALDPRWTGELDRLYEEFCAIDSKDGEVVAAMDRYRKVFTAIRASLDHEGWRHLATTALRDHPMRSIIHQDPFQRRCFEKPRGYAGDAVMLDMIYAADGVVPHPPD